MVNSNSNTIYALLCYCHAEEGFRYVGKSNNPTRRLKEHKKAASPTAPSVVHRWLARHGKENLRMVLIEENILDDDVLELELFYIRKYRDVNPFLLNMKFPVLTHYAVRGIPVA